jgi:hypothetical protein
MTGCSCGNCELCAPGKPRVDPGNEPSKAKPHTLPWLIGLIRKHKGISITASESLLFVAEIDRLREKYETPGKVTVDLLAPPKPLLGG